MKKILALVVVLVLASFSLGYAFAATKTYQVTGPVISVTSDSIVVQKGKDNWEIARDANTKVTGDVKPGAKVVIQYRMTATTIDVQAATAAAKKKGK
jgi:hypothetical protein